MASRSFCIIYRMFPSPPVVVLWSISPRWPSALSHNSVKANRKQCHIHVRDWSLFSGRQRWFDSLFSYYSNICGGRVRCIAYLMNWEVVIATTKMLSSEKRSSMNLQSDGCCDRSVLILISCGSPLVPIQSIFWCSVQHLIDQPSFSCFPSVFSNYEIIVTK